MVTATLPSVRTDPEHGGRWTTLRVGGREWLWHRVEPARVRVRPGDAFLDAGGLEECVPTVRGVPDHGSAWTRAWRVHGDEQVVDCSDFVLRRRIRTEEQHVTVRYRLHAAAGFRFVWAAHALLDLRVDARIVLPDGALVRLYPEAAPLLDGAWPPGAPFVTGQWPNPRGIALSELGADDGTAVGATVPGVDSVTVIDGHDRLSMRLAVDDDVPVSVAIWRNLGGFPADAPYRSIGVEPMLGAVFDLATAGPRDAATVPADGQLEWTLHLDAS